MVRRLTHPTAMAAGAPALKTRCHSERRISPWFGLEQGRKDQSEILRCAQDDSEGLRMTGFPGFRASVNWLA